MFKVFISHSSNDKPFVRRVSADLSNFGIDSWLDENEIHIGDSIRRSIEAGLGEADYFLLVISSSSVAKPWVSIEIDAALSIEIAMKRKFILPVLIDNADIPQLLAGRLYADFRQDYGSALRKLVSSIRNSSISLLETISSHTVLDIGDTNGKLVDHKKTQVIKCTKGTIVSYIEQSSTTGKMLDIEVFPSGPTKVWEEGGRIFLEHFFNKPLNEGEELNRGFTAKIINMFIDTENYWEVRHDYPSKEVIISIVFPLKRPPLSWQSYEKRGISRIQHSWCELLNSGGRSLLQMRIENPRQFTTSVLRWQW